ncbi:hypothetical protein [Brevibacterium renqingii]|uniref:hypothetical protein n=1 Tax=Brevibacterium renqingii TaxID=2776916 RepID=UPI001ADF953E|nr:hypothetical protein [Brevibacterium renqingii]
MTFVAIFTVMALVGLAGCADSSPVAAPTSTLPQPQPSGQPTDAATDVDIPEYETDLDLTPEEEEAVDGALVAFVGYISTINRVFSSGGKDMHDVEVFASDKSLRSLRKSAADLENDGKYMAGEYDFYDVRIQNVNVASKPSENDSVSILFCSHDSEHAVVEVGKPMPSQAEQSLTILQTATKQNEHWKISNQELWSKRCE